MADYSMLDAAHPRKARCLIVFVDRRTGRDPAVALELVR